MVSARGASEYGPLNESRGGEIRYHLDGPPFAVQNRRESAYKQMHDHCEGDYFITREWDELDGVVSNVSVNTNRSSYNQAELEETTEISESRSRHIEFECRRPGRARHVRRR